jgi:hypothetical protein
MNVKLVDIAKFKAMADALEAAGESPASEVIKDYHTLAHMPQPDAILFVCADEETGEPAMVALWDDEDDKYSLIGAANPDDADVIVQSLRKYIPSITALDLRRTQ